MQVAKAGLTDRYAFCIDWFMTEFEIPSLFSRLGGITRVAAEIGVPTGTASAWQSRGSIPVSYWPKLIESAAQRGVSGVTYDALVALHSQRKRNSA
jgi:hypothetical protein